MKKDPPICDVCKKKTVLANAGIFEAILYFYCRNCKFEVNDFGVRHDYVKIGSFKEVTLAYKTWEESLDHPYDDDFCDYEYFDCLKGLLY